MNSTCCLKAFHSPTRSALSQLNLGLLDTVSILLFICVLICLHMGSVHQDGSGLKHIPHLTPCYMFMWANISNRNSHVGRHVLFSNHHPCSSSNISITWVTSLASSTSHTCVASQYMTCVRACVRACVRVCVRAFLPAGDSVSTRVFVFQSCPMWRLFFFLSRLPTASNNSIALLRSSPSMDLWTGTLHAV